MTWDWIWFIVNTTALGLMYVCGRITGKRQGRQEGIGARQAADRIHTSLVYDEGYQAGLRDAQNDGPTTRGG